MFQYFNNDLTILKFLTLNFKLPRGSVRSFCTSIFYLILLQISKLHLYVLSDFLHYLSPPASQLLFDNRLEYMFYHHICMKSDHLV